MKKTLAAAALALALAHPAPAPAGEADVVAAEARQVGATWTFTVTVRHDDEGWSHYADAWRVVAPDGTVLGERKLLHPHETEQPFTRSLSGVSIPDDVDVVTIEAHDNVHGWGGAAIETPLPR
ncbi:MAG: hypothetical protein AAF322_04410 [Pseudomonadota bacterium]